MKRLPHLLAILAAVLLVAADKAEKAEGDKVQKPSGLTISLEVPGGIIQADEKTTAKLWLKNNIDKPMMLFVPPQGDIDFHYPLIGSSVFINEISAQLYCEVKLLESHVDDKEHLGLVFPTERGVLETFKLPPGHREALLLDISPGMTWYEKDGKLLLLPGRYSVSVTYKTTGPDWYWSGKVTTQPVEFVVVEPEQQSEPCSRRQFLSRIRGRR